jgi:hypothetical protein
MPVPAIAEPSAVQTAPPLQKKERISKRMREVLTLLATKGMTQRDAANKVGMSETYLSGALRKPEIQAFIARKVRETIALGTLRASARVLELVDAASEHVSLDASKHVLAIEGIRPPSDAHHTVNVGVSVGYVIDLAGKGAPQQGVTLDISPSYVTDGTEQYQRVKPE